jgi:hypothetical protein
MWHWWCSCFPNLAGCDVSNIYNRELKRTKVGRPLMAWRLYQVPLLLMLIGEDVKTINENT